MANSELSLEVSQSNNTKLMRLVDTSFYYKDEITDNYLIEVLPVNKTDWLTFNVTRKFSLTLNSSNLRYRKAIDTDELISIPDGIYEIKQSYKPNLKTVNHYYHLRTTQLSNMLISEFCKLLNDKCDISRADYFKNRDKLRDIEEYIRAAKWMVEECAEKDKGKELYDFSKKLLEDYTNECKC